MNPLIINQPTLAPLHHRWGWALVTACFWMLWIYMWLPLVTAVAWGMSMYRSYLMLGLDSELREMRRLALVYLTVILALGGGLMLWAWVEFMRFRHVSRRSKPLPVPVAALADYAGLPLQQITGWQQARHLVAHHDSQGRLTHMIDL